MELSAGMTMGRPVRYMCTDVHIRDKFHPSFPITPRLPIPTPLSEMGSA